MCQAHNRCSINVHCFPHHHHLWFREGDVPSQTTGEDALVSLLFPDKKPCSQTGFLGSHSSHLANPLPTSLSFSLSLSHSGNAVPSLCPFLPGYCLSTCPSSFLELPSTNTVSTRAAAQFRTSFSQNFL